MTSDPKAMLYERQALIAAKVAGEDDPMGSSRTKESEALGDRIRAAFAACGGRESEVRRAICQELGISNQALSGWIKTGRISKSNLPVVAKHTGQSVDYFLGTADMTAQEQDEVELVLVARQLPDALKANLLAHAQSLLELALTQAPPPPKTPKKK